MQILKVYDLSMLFAEIIELVKADSMRHNDALY